MGLKLIFSDAAAVNTAGTDMRHPPSACPSSFLYNRMTRSAAVLALATACFALEPEPVELRRGEHQIEVAIGGLSAISLSLRRYPKVWLCANLL
jgi:hypothetical protein